MLKGVLGLIFLSVAAACATSSAAPGQHGRANAERAAGAGEIRAVLNAQQSAWNRGDIDGFMEGYWRSPDLRFASAGSVTRGWMATLDRYRRVYADRAAMGRLEFSDLEVDVVSGDAAIVHGRWKLYRANDEPSGLYTLIFRRIGGDWVIVSDTTTSAE